MTSTCYFAHPVDQSSAMVDFECGTLRRELQREFDWVFDPGGAWSTKNKAFDPRIQQVNMQAAAAADVVVAYLPANVATVGTVVEVVEASQRGIPVLVVCPSRPVGLGSLTGVAFCEIKEPSEAEFAEAAQFASILAAKIEGEPPPPVAAQVVPGGTGHYIKLPEELEVSMTEHVADHGTVKWSGRDDHFRAPIRDGDCGFDLVSEITLTISPGVRLLVPTSVHVAGPTDVWWLVLPRSSSWKRGLHIEPGVIDAGYRGEWLVKAHNIGIEDVTIEAGERVAQGIPLPIMRFATEHVPHPELPAGDRGSLGWGSSGA